MGTFERNQIIEEYLPFIYKIASGFSKKLSKSRLEIDELVSYGVIGAIKAIERFDGLKGLNFKSYLYLRVKNEMIDGIRTTSRFSRDMMKLMTKYYDLRSKLNREPTKKELFERLNVSKVTFDNFLLKFYKWEMIASLNAQVKNTEGEKELQGAIVDLNSEYETRVVNYELLSHGLKRLNQNEIEIIWLYFYEGLLLEDIAAVKGCGASNVSNIKNRAVRKMREFYAC